MTIQLGFSTLGEPRMPTQTIAELIEDTGIRGLEMRIAEGEPLTADSAPSTAVGIRNALEGAHPLVLATYIGLADAAGTDPVRSGAAELGGAARLARAAGFPGIRVFMKDAVSEVESAIGLTAGERLAIERLAASAPVLAESGVRVLIETHDSHSSAGRLRRFLDALEASAPGIRPHVGVLWDTAHTWASGEELIESLDILGADIAHLQVKDVRRRTDPVPVSLGAGEFPIDELGEVLAQRGWHGWASLEWERAWHPELEPLRVALSVYPRWARALNVGSV